jgi:hypothetical protein
MRKESNSKARRTAAAVIALAASAVVIVPATTALASTYSDIALANASSSGSSVTVDNVTISNVLNYNSSYGYNLDIQDASGGTQLFRFPTTAFNPAFTPAVGQIIDVTATNDPFGGNNEFSNSSASVSLVSTGAFVPPVITTSIANSATPTGAGSTYLSETVQLDNVRITAGTAAATSPDFLSGGTYFATDAFGTAELYIYNSDSAVAALEGTPVPTGPVNITAFVDYYSTGSIVELYPTAIAATPEPAALGLVAAAGALMVARRKNSPRSK